MLADPEELSTILELDEEPQYQPAVVYGGELLTRRQLVDATASHRSMTAIVLGDAFYVGSQKDEESLRFSVTNGTRSCAV
jgi:DTW domain-containing protein YfiP